MAANEIHVGDVGTVFTFTIKDGDDGVDISGMTLTDSIIFEKSDGTTLVKDGTFVTDGTDFLVKYTTITNDLNTAGTWRVQALIIIGSGSWKSDIQTFKVYPNI